MNSKSAILIFETHSVDDGKVKVFEGYRIIHSTYIGPSKGGIRYGLDVNDDEVACALKALVAGLGQLTGVPSL